MTWTQVRSDELLALHRIAAQAREAVHVAALAGVRLGPLREALEPTPYRVGGNLGWRTDESDGGSEHPHLDAIALVHATARHDEAAVTQILDSAELCDVAVVLAQMLQTAVRTQGMSVARFLDMQTDKTISKANDEEGGPLTPD